MSCVPVEELQMSVLGCHSSGTYLDHIRKSILRFWRSWVQRCPGIRRKQADLSPTYSHLPNASWWNETFGIDRDKFQWKTLAAGGVEGRARGIVSGEIVVAWAFLFLKGFLYQRRHEMWPSLHPTICYFCHWTVENESRHIIIWCPASHHR
jgi:hypothetical protein